MDNQPTREQRLWEALEACRPGSDDLADPAMADLADELASDAALRERFRRVQAIDARLIAAFQDVPVPEGLAERLYRRLAQAGSEQADVSGEGDAAATSIPAASALPRSRPRRITRRRFIAATGALAAMAAAAVVAVVYFDSQPQYTLTAVLNEAIAAFEGDRGAGFLLTDPANQPPDEFPLSREVRRVPNTRWRTVQDFLGCRTGVAYDIPAPDGTIRATLYVVRMTAEGVDASVPALRPQNTGGLCSTAWQENDLLYVLVVRGDRRAYEDCLAEQGVIA